jgi:hypothetical protein
MHRPTLLEECAALKHLAHDIRVSRVRT